MDYLDLLLGDSPSLPLTQHQLSAIEHVPDLPTLQQFLAQPFFTPAKKLIASILEDAIYCIRGRCTPAGLSGVMLRCERGKVAKETKEWVESESEALHSFVWCCYSLGLEPKGIRKMMLKYLDTEAIHLSETVKFNVWGLRNNPEKKFTGTLELHGERIAVDGFPSRKEAIDALHREYKVRTEGGCGSERV